MSAFQFIGPYMQCPQYCEIYPRVILTLEKFQKVCVRFLAALFYTAFPIVGGNGTVNVNSHTRITCVVSSIFHFST